MSDEAQALPPGDVAPVPNVNAGAVPATSVPEPSATAPAAVSTGAEPASAPSSEPVAAGHGDVPNGASPVVFSVDENTPASVKDALKSVSESPIAASLPAEPQTFEQRVEARFLALEHALTELPHSIHTVMGQGSMDAESFGKAVIAHLFSKL